MKIVGARIQSFGGVHAAEVTFNPGMNVVLGDNESGKSTLFQAIHHTLLSPTNLDKRALRRELGPFFPRPEGNVAECSLTIESDGEYVIRRRWGVDAEEEMSLPDGTTVRGAADVSHVVNRVLPVTAATFRTILLADQSQLDATAQLLKENPAGRDEAAAALRNARLATGGVSPDVFMRLLDGRLRTLLGRWNAETGRPNGDRDYRNRWKSGAGDIVKAFYRVQELEAKLEEVRRGEAELDRVRLELQKTVDELSACDAFIADHSDTYAELNETRGLAAEIAAADEKISRLRDANRRWPVAKRDEADLCAQIEELTATIRELESELAAVRDAERDAARRDALARIDALLAEREEISARLRTIPVIDDGAVEQLREIESRLPYAEARLATGQLRVTVTATEPRPISVAADGEEPVDTAATPDEPLRLTASGQLVLTTDALRIQMESGDEPFDTLRSERDSLIERRDTLRANLGIGSLADVADGAARRNAALDRLLRVEEAIQSETETADMDSAMAAREELARSPAAVSEGAEHASSGAVGRDQAAITGALQTASRDLGAANGRLEDLRRELEQLRDTYHDQDELENALGEANRVRTELIARRDGRGALPDGFASAEEFLNAYGRAMADRSAAAKAHEEARVLFAGLVAGQDDETSEELSERLAGARADLERLRADAASLGRVRDRAAEVLEMLDESVFDPFIETVARYAGEMTGARYTPVVSGDPLHPERFVAGATPRAVELPYELLSQGTRDSLALAVRLALAETVLGRVSAPFILDDPLVDMDPSRRSAAARVLTEFAGHNQVILLTCHPDHAALFPRAHRIDLPRPA